MKRIRIYMVIPLLAIFATVTTCHACSHSNEGEAPSGPFSSTSPVILNSILQSNMVLQRNADVPFRGTGGTPGAVRESDLQLDRDGIHRPGRLRRLLGGEGSDAGRRADRSQSRWKAATKWCSTML